MPIECSSAPIAAWRSSTDAGVTWNFVDPTPATGAQTVWDVVVHHGGIIDICGDDRHRRSTDGGATWTTATGTPLQPLPSGRCSLTVSPDEDYVLFAASGTTIFESDNGGQSWQNNYPNPSSQGRIPFVATNQRAGATYDLWFGDVSLHRATCTTPNPAAPGGAQRCNASTAWANATTGAHNDSGDIAFAPGVANDACPILFSSDGGVYRNLNGGESRLPHSQLGAAERHPACAVELQLFGLRDGRVRPPSICISATRTPARSARSTAALRR